MTGESMAPMVSAVERGPLAYSALFLLLVPCSWGLYWLVWPKGPDPDDPVEKAIRRGKKVRLIVAGILAPVVLIWLAVSSLVEAFHG